MAGEFDELLKHAPVAGQGRSSLFPSVEASSDTPIFQNLLDHAPSPQNPPEKLGTGEGFVKSSLHSLGPELIGITNPEVEQFRIDNPFLGLVSLFAGAALPYGVGLKAGSVLARSIPGLKQVVEFGRAERALKGATGQFLPEAAATAAEFAPFGLARLIGAATAGDEDSFRRTLGNLAIETPLIAGASGALKAFRSKAPTRTTRRTGGTGEGSRLGVEGRVGRSIEGYEIDRDPQDKIAALLQFRSKASKNISQDLKQDIDEVIRDLSGTVFKQRPKSKVAFVQKLDRAKPSASGLNKLFRGEFSGVKSELLPSDVRTQGARIERELLVDQVMAPGTPIDEFAKTVQYPRVLKTDDPKKLQERIKSLFDNNQVGIGNDEAWLAKEVNGVYVLARKIKPTAPGKGPQPAYMIFKTTAPEKFVAKHVGKTLDELPVRGAFHREVEVETSKQIAALPEARMIQTILNSMADSDVSLPVSQRVSTAILNALRPEHAKLRGNAEVVGTGVVEASKRWIAPSLFQGSRDPDFVALLNAARLSQARGLARATKIMFGRIPQAKGSLFTETVFPSVKKGGLERLIDQLDGNDFAHLRQAFNSGMTASEARTSLGASGRVARLLRELGKVDDDYARLLVKVEDLIGKPLNNPSAKELMIARSWRGDLRMPVYRKVGRTNELESTPIGWVSGTSVKGIKKEAEDTVKLLSKDSGGEVGFGWRTSDILRSNRMDDLARARTLAKDEVRAVGFQQARAKTIEEEVLKASSPARLRGEKKELKRIVIGNMVEQERLIADNTFNSLAKPFMDRLLRRDPELGLQLQERLRFLAGQDAGPGFLDILVDSFLAPHLGKGVAAKVVQNSNKVLFGLTLGFGDLGFAAINATTPILTGLPEAAFVMSAAPATLARYYSHFLVMGKSGIPRSVAHLDPIRLLSRSMRDMGKPSKDLKKAFQWAETNGVIDPKYVEAFVGENSSTVKNWRGLLTGEQGFGEFILSVGNSLPIMSEKFTRGASFTMGYNLGKDFLRLEGEQLWRFAGEYVARTNFLYSTADRAKLITGTIGTGFGLFKNWGMHQFGNMMVYAGEAVARKNVKPFTWMMMTTGAMGGAGALPFYGTADTASRVLTDKRIADKIFAGMDYLNAPDAFSNAFMYGLPAFGGVTVQGRVAPTGNHFARDLEFLTKSAALDRMGMFSDAMGESITDWENTGRNPLLNEVNLLRFVRAISPRTLYRSLSFTEDRALRSLRTGNPLISETTFGQRAAFALGLTPIDFEKHLEIDQILSQDEDKRKEAVRSFGEAWEQAQRNGNVKEITYLMKRMFDEGIAWDDVSRSVDARARRQNNDSLEARHDDYATLQKKRLFRLD